MPNKKSYTRGYAFSTSDKILGGGFLPDFHSRTISFMRRIISTIRYKKKWEDAEKLCRDISHGPEIYLRNVAFQKQQNSGNGQQIYWEISGKSLVKLRRILGSIVEKLWQFIGKILSDLSRKIKIKSDRKISTKSFCKKFFGLNSRVGKDFDFFKKFYGHMTFIKSARGHSSHFETFSI